MTNNLVSTTNITGVTFDNEELFVSARYVHSLLDTPPEFNYWCKTMFQYGFQEIFDYKRIEIGTGKGHNKIDYLLTQQCFEDIVTILRRLMKKQTYILKKKNALFLKKNKNNISTSAVIYGNTEDKLSHRDDAKTQRQTNQEELRQMMYIVE